jgi:hypothetical protein
MRGVIPIFGQAWRAAMRARGGTHPVAGKLLLASAATIALVGFGTAVAAGAPKPNEPTITFVSPSPSEGATLTTNSVTFAFTYNRTPKQTQSLACTLAGPTSSSGVCEAPTAIPADGSKSGKSYSGLADGSYTFTALLTLTDGGTASATRHFTVTAGSVTASVTPIAGGRRAHLRADERGRGQVLGLQRLRPAW